MINNYNSQNRLFFHKKKYKTPEIKVYGKVEEITFGAPGSGLDGAPGLAVIHPKKN